MVSFARSSMGNYPSLVYFFLNCVQILKIGGRLGRMFPLLAPQFQEKQWQRCSMVLLNGKFPKLGKYLEQLCLHTLELGGRLGRIHCLCQLLNCKKNNGRNVVWCSSMGNSPNLVSFLLNCVYILHHIDQVNVFFASSSIARKTMVEILYWLLSQLMDSFLLNSLFISCSSMYTKLQAKLRNLWWRCLIHKTRLCENMVKKIMFAHCL